MRDKQSRGLSHTLFQPISMSRGEGCSNINNLSPELRIVHVSRVHKQLGNLIAVLKARQNGVVKKRIKFKKK